MRTLRERLGAVLLQRDKVCIQSSGNHGVGDIAATLNHAFAILLEPLGRGHQRSSSQTGNDFNHVAVFVIDDDRDFAAKAIQALFNNIGNKHGSDRRVGRISARFQHRQSGIGRLARPCGDGAVYAGCNRRIVLLVGLILSRVRLPRAPALLWDPLVLSLCVRVGTKNKCRRSGDQANTGTSSEKTAHQSSPSKRTGATARRDEGRRTAGCEAIPIVRANGLASQAFPRQRKAQSLVQRRRLQHPNRNSILRTPHWLLSSFKSLGFTPRW